MNPGKRPQQSIKTISLEERETLISQLKLDYEKEKDAKKKNAIKNRINYIRNAEKNRQKRREKYLEQHKDVLQKKYKEKLDALMHISSTKNNC